MARVLIQVPASARRGEVIELRATIAHPMETGYRPGADGQLLPRDIVQRFTCRYNGQVVFAAELHPAISANPYVAFHTVANESGTLEFEWSGDKGFSHVERRQLQVT
jgi:sulfur-oxidizing protein SoxZ